MKTLRADWVARMSSSSFNWSAAVSLFCEDWMTNTIQNVTTVVPVLMTSCQLSEKWKSGPLAAQIRTTVTESTKAVGRPVAFDTARAKERKPWAESIVSILTTKTDRLRACQRADGAWSCTWSRASHAARRRSNLQERLVHCAKGS
jgi:hypothetical protein